MGAKAIGVVVFVAVLLFAGCGGSAQVVTVTQSVTNAVTETVAAESAKTPLTSDDQAWVDLIQSQNSAIETLLGQLQAAGQSAGASQAWTDATTELVGLRADLNRAGIVGVSPCMQRVAVDWVSAFSTFEEAFGGAMGGLRGQLTDNAPAQRARRAVQAELTDCLATMQAPASTTGSGSAGPHGSTTGGCTAYAGKDPPELGTRSGCELAGSGLCDTKTQLRSWGVSCEDAKRMMLLVGAGETDSSKLDGFTCTPVSASEPGRCVLGSRQFEFYSTG